MVHEGSGKGPMERGHHQDAHEMLLGMMRKYLDEDQVRTLVLRMIDSRIKMKPALGCPDAGQDRDIQDGP